MKRMMNPFRVSSPHRAAVATPPGGALPSQGRWLLAVSAWVCLGAAAPSMAQAPATGVAQARAPASGATTGHSLQEVQNAEALYQQGKNAQALEAFSALVEKYPRNAYFWFRLGNALARDHSFRDAIGAYDSAIALDPSDGRFYFNQSLMHLALAKSGLIEASGKLPSGESLKAEADHLLKLLTEQQEQDTDVPLLQGKTTPMGPETGSPSQRFILPNSASP